MSTPYEQKYNQLKKSMTHYKGRYQEMKDSMDRERSNNYELWRLYSFAENTLLSIGYRRLPDGSWTNEPFIDSTLVEKESEA